MLISAASLRRCLLLIKDGLRRSAKVGEGRQQQRATKANICEGRVLVNELSYGSPPFYYTRINRLSPDPWRSHDPRQWADLTHTKRYKLGTWEGMSLTSRTWLPARLRASTDCPCVTFTVEISFTEQMMSFILWRKLKRIHIEKLDSALSSTVKCTATSSGSRFRANWRNN